MPNGRSGGFLIEKGDLKQLVQALPDSSVAKVIIHSPSLRPADAFETAQLVDDCRNDHISVEEQDHKLYIIHLSEEPQRVWMMVGSETPLFLGLRQRHGRWVTEHPECKGWVAF